MNKKVVLGIIVTVVLAGIIGGVVAFVLLRQPKIKPEDIWQSYISLINEHQYEKMYEMITQDSKNQYVFAKIMMFLCRMVALLPSKWA